MTETESSSRKRTASESEGTKHVAGIALANEYAGFQPEVGIQQLTDRVSPDVAADGFFTEFVKQRRPAVFKASLVDDRWKGHLWDLPYLFRKAKDSTILVEDRPDLSNGKSSSTTFIEMYYREFLSSLISGETRYQLTSSDVQCSMSDLRDRNGFMTTVSQPLQTLADDFPLRPEILGKLIPHQVALCQGYHTATQHGLHHYFHDSLYVLLRGHQRFRLFPPSTITLLSSPKCPLKIHSNGLAVYLPAEKSKQKAACVRADGVPMVGVARMKRDHAENELIEAEARLIKLRHAGAESNPDMADQLQQATAAMKDCEMMVDIASDELQRFYSDYEDNDNDGDNGDVISIHDDDSEPETTTEPPAAKQPRISDDDAAVTTVATETAAEAEISKDELMVEYWQANSYNVCLAREDTDVVDVLFAACPQLKESACLVVDLKPGEMLYLPASWLYEVSAVPSPCDSSPPTAVNTVQATAMQGSSETNPGTVGSDGQNNEQLSANVCETDATISNNTDTEPTATECAPTAVDTQETGGVLRSKEDGGETVETANTGGDEAAAGDKASETNVVIESGSETVQAQITGGGQTSAGGKASETNVKIGSGGETVQTPSTGGGETSTGHKALETSVQLAGGGDAEAALNMLTSPDITSLADDTVALMKKLENASPDTDFLAVNYLLHPPDGPSFDRPYLDTFWQDRWTRMEPEIKRMLRKSSRLASDVITLGSSSSSSEYDESSDCEDLSDDYEDSEGSNSPIFLEEKRQSGGEDQEFGSFDADEIEVDGNSSNAIILGDDDDDDDVVCSSEEEDKNGNSSIVVCDGNTSVLDTSPPCSGTQPSVLQSQDVDSESNNCTSSAVESQSQPPEHSATDSSSETGTAKITNLGDTVEATTDGKPASESSHPVNDEAGIVLNGSHPPKDAGGSC